MQVLQKIVDKGGNWTGGDSGAKRSGKGVALAEKKLDEFKGNATLVEACSALAGEEGEFLSFLFRFPMFYVALC